MARMLTKFMLDSYQRCCEHCTDRSGRWTHGARKDPRFRKMARARDKTTWKREET